MRRPLPNMCPLRHFLGSPTPSNTLKFIHTLAKRIMEEHDACKSSMCRTQISTNQNPLSHSEECEARHAAPGVEERVSPPPTIAFSSIPSSSVEFQISAAASRHASLLSSFFFTSSLPLLSSSLFLPPAFFFPTPRCMLLMCVGGHFSKHRMRSEEGNESLHRHGNCIAVEKTRIKT